MVSTTTRRWRIDGPNVVVVVVVAAADVWILIWMILRQHGLSVEMLYLSSNVDDAVVVVRKKYCQNAHVDVVDSTSHS